MIRKRTATQSPIYSEYIPIGNEGKMRTFSDYEKLREFVTSRPTLKE